ncbi:MAG: flagellar basal body rod protein FlgC [Gammaproteobacteria bacterium]
METAAANIAHVNDTIRPADASTATHQKPESDPDSDAFRPKEAVRSSLASGGVRTDTIEKDPPHELSYAPDDPHADENGLVARPNINMENEFVAMIMSRRAFQANLKSIRTADAMTGALLSARI